LVLAAQLERELERLPVQAGLICLVPLVPVAVDPLVQPGAALAYCPAPAKPARAARQQQLQQKHASWTESLKVKQRSRKSRVGCNLSRTFAHILTCHMRPLFKCSDTKKLNPERFTADNEIKFPPD
jgi:hypothetical protein